jgi:putative IMPACT (imprinted ancient) family translation regulator
VRYFGGTKLGVPGLISAYGDAASETLPSATIIRQTITKTFKVNFEYAQISFVERICKIENLEVIDREQGVKLSYTISVIQSKFEEIKEQFESNHLLTVTH